MNINYLPQGERLLSGSLSLLLTDVATTATVSTPPSASKLPCYFEFEPDSTANRELTRVIGVSGSVVTLERGLNNGGVGIAHQANSAYKQKITSLHLNKFADAIQNGYLLEDAIRALIRVGDTQLTITGYGASDDLSAFYTSGRYIRANSSDSNIFRITSSSYSAGTNKTTVNISGTLPGTLTTVELSLAGRGVPDLIADRKATGAEVDTGTDDTKIVTPLAATGIDTRTATFTNKTLTSPVIRAYDGWIDANETWTYASASTITVPTGAASKYAVGDRIKWTQTTVKYGVIVAVADTLLTIAVNTDYVVANTAISANYYSHEATPIGYTLREYRVPYRIAIGSNYGGAAATQVNFTAGTFTVAPLVFVTNQDALSAITVSNITSTGFTFQNSVGANYTMAYFAIQLTP